MSKEQAYDPAVNLAIEKLRPVDLDARCPALGLPKPQDNQLQFRAFGVDATLHLDDYRLVKTGTDDLLKISDRILILHYILCDVPLRFTDRLISFRELDGGQFYWPAFRGRSVQPLEKRFGNSVEQLRENLSRFDWEPVPIGDLSARIHAIGNLYVTLIYRLGDEELPPAADLLFDAAVKRVYNAEDAAVLAGRICLGLL
jgi:hypothetical protein